MSELTRRVLFSLVAIPVALGAIWYGDWALAALLAVAAALAANEYFGIARAAGHQPFARTGAALAGIVPLALHARRLGLFTADLAAIALVALLVLFAASIWRRWPGGRPLGAVAVTAFGVAYTGATLGYGYLLRYHPYAVGRTAGAALLALPLILTWTSDIGAYFVGRALGEAQADPGGEPGEDRRRRGRRAGLVHGRRLGVPAVGARPAGDAGAAPARARARGLGGAAVRRDRQRRRAGRRPRRVAASSARAA